ACRAPGACAVRQVRRRRGEGRTVGRGDRRDRLTSFQGRGSEPVLPILGTGLMYSGWPLGGLPNDDGESTLDLTMRPIVYHIPVCPFSQRLEILLALKERGSAVEFRVVDITKPRETELLALTRGTTALPIMQTEHGVIKEILVILRYLDETVGPSVARADPYERAVENMLI